MRKGLITLVVLLGILDLTLLGGASSKDVGRIAGATLKHLEQRLGSIWGEMGITV